MLGIKINLLKILFDKEQMREKSSDVNYQNYKLLGNRLQKSTNEHIKFLINEKEFISNNLIFYLYYFNTKKGTITMSRKTEKEIKEKKEIKSENEINKLDKEIIPKIKYLLDIINKDDFDLKSFQSLINIIIINRKKLYFNQICLI